MADGGFTGNAVATLNVANARLPQAYEAAVFALANCVSVDECMGWADKAQALASYARQSEDESLLNHAKRIQARAVRRCGELLKQVHAPGARTDRPPEGDHPRSATEAARSAGISAHQQKTATRVANVPAPTFEAAIESDTPPTVTALADMGRQRRETPPAAPAPVPPSPGFVAATHALGVVAEFAEWCRDNDPLFVAGGVDPREVSEARANVTVIDGWLDRFVVNMKG